MLGPAVPTAESNGHARGVACAPFFAKGNTNTNANAPTNPSCSRREAPAAAHWPSEAMARWYPKPFCMRRGAQRFADQGSPLFEVLCFLQVVLRQQPLR
ncbi:hypothetical protein, partial [Variovorax boronicumulans]|uniref:hypothetical protein n=1 Tax=Variovorax boronicumulans TaxID=436515 RepID=UPI0033953239